MSIDKKTREEIDNRVVEQLQSLSQVCEKGSEDPEGTEKQEDSTENQQPEKS